jgi:hypothetical protein
MDITSAKYVTQYGGDEIENIKVVMGDIISFVPIDPANTDYAEIMRQVEAGELTIAEAD